MLKRGFNILAPYRDVIVFMITLLVANYGWKYSVWGEESGEGSVTWLGILDLTAMFDAYARHITDAVYAICHCLRDGIYRVDEITLRWATGSGTRIVWSCTPIKQTFIWLCLMWTSVPAAALCRGQWRQGGIKTAWIVVGLVAIYAFNILRISIITLCMEHHPEWFEMLHTYVFKYLFYGMMFLLWVTYVETHQRAA